MELRLFLFCLFFCLLYFFLPPFEELGCFSGCLMSSASIQKLFFGIYSTFKCSFDEFVGKKVFSPSYSSAILAPPPFLQLLMFPFCLSKYSAVELLDHMVSLFLIFWESSIMLFTVAGAIYIPTNTAQGFPFLHILANTCYLLSF